MSNTTKDDPISWKLEALLEAARRANWDALHGPRHLRSGRFRPEDAVTNAGGERCEPEKLRFSTPAQDPNHEKVKNALINDGWAITHDPMRLRWGKKDSYVDLGTEQFLAAEKEALRIGVKTKGVLDLSSTEDLERTCGQYAIYRSILRRVEPERELFLAMETQSFRDLLEDEVGQLLLQDHAIKFIIFDSATENISQWIR